ncbi:AfsA-related hotdog domain-containing protein [Streptomyces sp. O3]
MSRPAALGGLDVTAVARQLTRHERPRGAPAGQERFTLHAEMPVGHALFNEDPGRHDAQIFVELTRRAGLHIGHRHFEVPAERPCLFYKFALRLTDPAVWSVALDGARMALDLRASPTKTVAGVPRGLRLGGAMAIDGAPGCTGSAELVFLTPTVARNHRAASRLAALDADSAPGTNARRPVNPAEVGRVDPANVVVSAPVGRGSALTTAVLVDPAHPVFFAESADSVPGLLLVEALRQSALLAAGRVHGLSARHTALTSMVVHVRGHAELDLPLACVAVTEPVARDEEGRRQTRVQLSLQQAGKVAAEAQVVAAETG